MVKKKKDDLKKEENKKEVCETFKIGPKGVPPGTELGGKKGGKEKLIKTCGEMENKEATKEQIEHQNKLLRNIFLLIGGLVIFFLIAYYGVDSLRSFKYEGIEFEVLNEKGEIFYHTSFPIQSNGKLIEYNVYLKKDPRIVGENVPFDGEVSVMEMMVLNMTGDFNCGGDGVIAIANFQQILTQAVGAKIIKDPNATCDSEGRYNLIQIQSGEKTEIKQIVPRCYEFNVKDCEILDVTERFLLEVLKRLNA